MNRKCLTYTGWVFDLYIYFNHDFLRSKAYHYFSQMETYSSVSKSTTLRGNGNYQYITKKYIQFIYWCSHNKTLLIQYLRRKISSEIYCQNWIIVFKPFWRYRYHNIVLRLTNPNQKILVYSTARKKISKLRLYQPGDIVSTRNFSAPMSWSTDVQTKGSTPKASCVQFDLLRHTEFEVCSWNCFWDILFTIICR